MSLDDVIYVLCLLGCIGAGHYVKKIGDETQRKFISTGLGLLVVFIASGFHALHCIISTTIGALVVIYMHPSRCHLVTFCIMFGYLVFFRLVHIFGLPNYPGHTNMIQMILTLKVSGIAFEKTAAWKKLRQRDKEIAERQRAEGVTSSEPLVEITDYDAELQDIGFAEIFHYCFNYIGVLTGPYYRYRTYLDYFEMPFKDYAPHISATIEKLKYAGLYCALYLVANYIWPLEYALSAEFYQERSFIYRLMYVWPTFFTFRMRIYTGLTLSECVCTMAGFGAYPDEADVANGEGPRKQYAHLRRDADKRTYNFTTIVNTRVRSVETCWTFREGMKHWNICIQYWLAVNVYKLFPSKQYRTIGFLHIYVTTRDSQRLQIFVNLCLHRILRIYWPNIISNRALWSRTQQTPLRFEILKRKWAWIAHTLHKPSNDVARNAFDWKPPGQRLVGRPAHTWRRQLDADFRTTGKSWGEISVWHVTEMVGTMYFTVGLCSLQE